MLADTFLGVPPRAASKLLSPTVHSVKRVCAQRAACAIVASIIASSGGVVSVAHAQSTPAEQELGESNPGEGRVIAEIVVEGLDRVPRLLIENTIRTAPGRPLEWATVREDLRNLERLGEFRDIQASIRENADRTVTVIYELTEAPIIEDIVVVGNRRVTDTQLAEVVNQGSLIVGVPIDDYRIGLASRLIEDYYRSQGFYLVDVTVDESELAETGVVIFRIREGERLQVTDIRFDGNDAFTGKQLRSLVESKVKGLFQKAPLDDGTLDTDVGALVEFYRNNGYLDVRVSRSVLPSPNAREAIVTFIVDEGPQYTLRNVEVWGVAGTSDNPAAGLTVYGPEQVAALMTVRSGEVFNAREIRASEVAVRDALRQMGYFDARVGSEQYRAVDSPTVDLRLYVDEGRRFKTGTVTIQGNEHTKDKVIRRDVDVYPDSWLDGTAIDESEQRLRNSGLYAPPGPSSQGPAVIVQPEDPRFPGYRDVLVRIEETNTGRIGFGAAVNSDSGLVGAISLDQRNFDIADTPDSLGEFLSGRAFRGAGQQFNLALQPGDRVSTYSVSLAEPRLFETPYSASGSAYFRAREFDEYDEERLGSRLRLGRAFGTRWSGFVSGRIEQIDISEIESFSTQDLFAVEGESSITGLGLGLTRTTIDSRFRPTAGTRLELGVEQIGLLGGDYDFTKLSLEHSIFLKIDEDYLGRPTVLSFDTRIGYIPQSDEAPIFERYNLGGRTFRGFDFRGIGPVGLRNDTGLPGEDQVGGDFSFFFGAQVERPVWRDIIGLAMFVDSGTVSNDFSLDEYRVTAGAGLRLYIPAFGQTPLAFDFAIPVMKEDTDDTQIFSFAFDLPF
jgi:outer membrane protein insertion porin family